MKVHANEYKDEEEEKEIDHRIPIMDMKILQIQLGIVGRIEYFLGTDIDTGVNLDLDSENLAARSPCRFYDEVIDCEGDNVGEDEIEINKENKDEVLRDVVLRWRRFEKASFGEDLDALRDELNVAVQRWLGSGPERDGEVKEEGDDIKIDSSDCGRIVVPFDLDLEDWEVI